MFPTFNVAGDIVLVDKCKFRIQKKIKNKQLEVGMIVVARSPGNPKTKVIKRIVGVQGDVMTTTHRYARTKTSTIEIEVPKGHVWLEGIYNHKEMHVFFFSKLFKIFYRR